MNTNPNVAHTGQSDSSVPLMVLLDLTYADDRLQTHRGRRCDVILSRSVLWSVSGSAALPPSAALVPAGLCTRWAPAEWSSRCPDIRHLCRARRTEGEVKESKVMTYFSPTEKERVCNVGSSSHLSRCQSSDRLRQWDPHWAVQVQSHRAGNWEEQEPK